MNTAIAVPCLLALSLVTLLHRSNSCRVFSDITGNSSLYTQSKIYDRQFHIKCHELVIKGVLICSISEIKK